MPQLAEQNENIQKAKSNHSLRIFHVLTGVSYLEGSDDESVMGMKIKVLNNLSAAQLKVSSIT